MRKSYTHLSCCFFYRNHIVQLIYKLHVISFSKRARIFCYCLNCDLFILRIVHYILGIDHCAQLPTPFTRADRLIMILSTGWNTLLIYDLVYSTFNTICSYTKKSWTFQCPMRLPNRFTKIPYLVQCFWPITHPVISTCGHIMKFITNKTSQKL